MSTLSPAQIASTAYAAGFRGKSLQNAVAVALAESGGRTDAVHVNSDKYRSRDRGLWQINDHWHPEVSDAQAFAPASAAAAAFRISGGGHNWSPWATWPVAAGAQQARARAGVAKFQQGGGGLSGSTSAGASGATTTGGNAQAADLGDYLSLPGDVLGAVVKTSNPLEVAKQGLFLIARAGLWMSDPHNWLRVAMVSGGTVAVLAGLGMLAKSGAAGQGAQAAANGATKVAKGGIEAGLIAATGGTGAAVKGGAAVVGATTKAAGKGTAQTAAQAAKLVTSK